MDDRGLLEASGGEPERYLAMAAEADDRRRVCNMPTPNGPCTLEPQHGGYHSVVTFVCDGCNKVRRGVPVAWDPEGDHGGPLGFCFFCTRQPDPRY